MNEANEQSVFETEIKNDLKEMPEQDDRYPGTFFRIPGAPITSNTAWKIN